MSALRDLAATLTSALGVRFKCDIQAAATHLPPVVHGPWGAGPVRLGDDCAAIPDRDGYLLFAGEGMWPQLVAEDPEFAAYCAVMVNVSDVYAMGGRPLALVNTLFATDEPAARPLWRGLQRGAERFGVPVVGGHTNLHAPAAGLSAAIVGRAHRLLTSFAARPGDDLVMAVDLRGAMHAPHPFWNASATGSPDRLRAAYEVLPALAEAELAGAGKDISMGGLVGTALMLLESSGVGATLWLDEIPRPAAVPWATWLLAFPSYGFLLAAPPSSRDALLGRFAAHDIAAAVVGRVDDTHHLRLAPAREDAAVSLWDLARVPLTGFGPGASP